MLLSFVLYAQAGDRMDLPGELWDACWGLQGVTSLAGEISALGLVLKQAEVAGAVGPSLLSGNQVGQASVLCPGFPPVVSPGPHHGDLPVVTTLSVTPAGSAGPSLVPTQWSLLQTSPAQQPRSPEP